MGLKSFFSKLTGSADGEPKTTTTVEYAGCEIRAQPKAQGGQFYTAGVIAKQFPDGLKEHYFIRADTHSSEEAASQHCVTKARQIIDEQGDRLFNTD